MRILSPRSEIIVSVVNKPCLVLNRHWQPITFSKVRTAIENVMRDMASILDPETYMLMTYEEWVSEERAVARWIKTTSGSVPAPEVVVLKMYGERPPQKIGFNRSNLFKRDDHECQYCGDALPGNRLQVEHVVPRSKGGPTSWDNCVAACNTCNSRKADRLPAEAGMRLKKEPAAPSWKTGVRLPQGVVMASWEPFLAKELVA